MGVVRRRRRGKEGKSGIDPRRGHFQMPLLNARACVLLTLFPIHVPGYFLTFTSITTARAHTASHSDTHFIEICCLCVQRSEREVRLAANQLQGFTSACAGPRRRLSPTKLHLTFETIPSLPITLSWLYLVCAIICPSLIDRPSSPLLLPLPSLYTLIHLADANN